jgi:hypothetical protein
MAKHKADLLVLKGQAIQRMVPDHEGRMSTLWQHGSFLMLCLK